MKSTLYFILACITIVYIGFLCYVNIYGIEEMALWMQYVSIYGGLVIALAYAAVNFFGSPLKIVFFILLIVMTILLVFTIAIPNTFRTLFKLDNAGQILNILKIMR